MDTSSVLFVSVAEANPEKFNSRFRNKMFYAGVSLNEQIRTQPKGP